MRTKALLTSILLATTAIAGVASADPFVRDHRYQQATAPYRSVSRPAPGSSWRARAQMRPRPSWMVNASANVNYGFQLDADGDEVQPYAYGQDPYVEGIARGEWMTLNPCIDVSSRGSTREALGMRPLQSLELQATRGGAYVFAVGFIFKDGSQRSFLVNRDLDSREPNMRFDLGNEGQQGVEAVVLETNGSASIRMLGA